MNILTQDLDREEAELKAKLEDVQSRRIAVAYDWRFVFENFVDPSPYQKTNAYMRREPLVCWYSKRAIGISIEVPTWEDAIAYAQNYEQKAARMSKVKTSTCSFLPATILDYGYEKEPNVERTVGGIAIADISGGVGHHTEDLVLCLVDHEGADSRYCAFHIRPQVHRYRQYCRPGDKTFIGPLPSSAVVVCYGSSSHIRHSSHGDLVSGSYHKVCMLGEGAPLSTWLPQKG